MREKLKALAELQTVDMEIAALRKAAETFPRQLAELEKELGVTRSATEAERAKLNDFETQRRTLEQNIVDEKEKVKKWESRLTEQRSTREYAALAREIDIAKKANQNMAEEVTELGKQLSAQREALKIKEQELLARLGQVGEKMAEIRQQMTGAEEQAKGLENSRSTVAAKVDATLLRRYETVKKKKLPALSGVLFPGTCQGCNMNLPPQQYNLLRSSLGTDVCPSCNRIIYAVEALEAPGTK